MDTTHWTVVLEARDGDSDARRRSLAVLCETYWLPLYAYVRRRGYGVEEAKELTQEFFTTFIEKDFLKNVGREKGKFRNFLLASLNHFLANEWHKRNAKKRGGGITILSIDVLEAESKLGDIAVTGQTPEDIYRRRWALSLLQRAYERLVQENSRGPAAERFEQVKGYIAMTHERVPYAELEASTGISSSALRVYVHRLRKRYGQLVREEILQTVADESEVDAELRDLLAAISTA